MKKISTLVLTLGISTIGGLVLAQTAHADDSATTNAQVAVTAGDLKIISVGDIDFGSQKISGGDLTAKASTTKVSIEDLRGSSDVGWTLKARLNDNSFDGMTFSMEETQISNGYSVDFGSNEINSQDQTILIAADETIGLTEFDTEFSFIPVLNIPAKTKANTYSTTIVWNLASTPESR
ncbi:WxL domain-containing protein [Enterococcus sp. AZ179]|uniref:WxL domain-containing protein n=1 Tax=Enterococcus sp. AZ179 TaxID=2774680 RepID=UPI003D2DC93B